MEGLLRLDLPEDVEILAFADDTVLLAYGDSRLVLEQNLHLAITTLEEWAESVKLTFSARKTKAKFLKRTLSMARPPTLRIGGRPVRFYEQVVYLGVTLDRRLSFLPHVKDVCLRARTLFGKVLRLIRLEYGVQPSVNTILYRTVFCPIVQYAQRAWQHRIGHSHAKKALRVSQRSVLLSMAGAYRTVSFQALTVILGQAPIDMVIQEHHAIWQIRHERIQMTLAAARQATIMTW